jgi:hypothetical protein
VSDLSQYTASTSSIDATTRKYFCGLFASETAGSTARVTVRNGGAAGTIVFDRTLTASGNADIVPTDTVQFPDGIYVKIESGTVQLALLTC